MHTRSFVRRHLFAIGGASLLAFGALATGSLAQIATDPARLARFDASRPDNKEPINYKVVDAVLAALVIANGNTSEVRYDVIKGDGERILTELISGFAMIDPVNLNHDEQLAYWLNLRALIALRSAGQALPATKVDKLLAPDSAFFTTRVVKVGGVDLSIADIDTIILKRGAGNPNIIYGLVLPVQESPAFPRKAFRGATVAAALDEAARAFINRSVKANGGSAQLPQFLIGHRARIGGDDAAVLTHIRSVANPKLRQKLLITNRVTADSRLSLNAFVQRSFADRETGGIVRETGGGSAAGS